jgi:hypothetical protein
MARLVKMRLPTAFLLPLESIPLLHPHLQQAYVIQVIIVRCRQLDRMKLHARHVTIIPIMEGNRLQIVRCA